ncbi:MAG: hypothetical protein AB7K24_18305 [Gemmataceae bacterium]
MKTPDAVQRLKTYHETVRFDDLDASQREARQTYKSLDKEQIGELVKLALSELNAGNDRLDHVFPCLACFQPGSLLPFHDQLIERDILHPGVIG